jgi:hypothetical protein
VFLVAANVAFYAWLDYEPYHEGPYDVCTRDDDIHVCRFDEAGEVENVSGSTYFTITTARWKANELNRYVFMHYNKHLWKPVAD